MVDIKKQIRYWIEGAEDAIDTADILLKKRKYITDMVNTEIITLIQTFLRRLIQEGIPVEKAFLYGSYARGEENDESDIDVLLVSEIFDGNDDEPVGKTWRISSLIDTRIEPYTVGKKKFLTDQFSPLLQIVKQEGLEISA